MNEILIIESAYEDGKFIGYRITVDNSSYLIWADQKKMQGLRVGDSFVPQIGKEIIYAKVII